MSEAIEQPGEAALPRPMGVGEILSAAFQLYQRHWRTLLAIAAELQIEGILPQLPAGVVRAARHVHDPAPTHDDPRDGLVGSAEVLVPDGHL